MTMRIEGVTVCIGFADFLATTLPSVMDFVDHLTVVTSAQHYPECFQLLLPYMNTDRVTLLGTDRHLEGGADFNKGKAINDGLGVWERTDWLVHLDADVVLPAGLRDRVEKWVQQEPDAKHSVIGIHRYLCNSYQTWLHYLATKSTNLFEQNRRQDRKHLPVGFFQLWHSSTGHVYPENHPTATSSDLAFSKQFMYRRHMEEWCIHLDTVEKQRWTNWRGRTTPRWGV